MGSFTKLKKIIDQSDRILLIGHIRPDGDSLGALLALGNGLSAIGKETTLVCKDPYPSVFDFLEGKDKIKKDFLLGGYDSIILLDNGDLKRTGFSDRLLLARQKRIPIINIDHHTKNDLWKFVTVNYVDETSSSTSVLVYEIMNGLGIGITPNIATALLTGIYTDTGGFQHSNTSAGVFEVVSQLLKKGAKLKYISDSITNSRSVGRLKLWGLALDRLVLNEKFGIAGSVIFQKDLLKVNASEEEVSGLVNLMNSIPEAKISLLLYEAGDGIIKGSLRTENDGVDVSLLAKYLGGGGHKKASGFSFNGTIVEEGSGWRIV